MQEVQSALLQEGALTRLVVRLLKISGHTMRCSDPHTGRLTMESAARAMMERPGGPRIVPCTVTLLYVLILISEE
jgi:hypothetical protein